MQVSVGGPAFNSLGHIPRSGIAEWHENPVFNSLRDHTVSTVASLHQFSLLSSNQNK